MLRRLMMAGGSGPTGFAVWDTAAKGALTVLSNSDRTANRSGSGTAIGTPRTSVRANIGKSTGKWYFEISSPLDAYTGNAEESAGIIASSLDATSDTLYVGLQARALGYCYRRTGGGGSGVQEIRDGAASFVTGGTARPNDGYMGIAADLDTGRAWCIINGTWAFGASPVSTPAGRYTFPAGTLMYPAITIQSGIVSRPEALHTLNAGQASFLNVSPTDFNPGGVLAGFNPGWYT